MQNNTQTTEVKYQQSPAYGDLVDMRSSDSSEWMGPFFYLGEIPQHKSPHFGIGADWIGLPNNALRCHKHVRMCDAEVVREIEDRKAKRKSFLESIAGHES